MGRRQCEAVLKSGQWEVEQKEAEVASYQKRLALLSDGGSGQKHSANFISSGNGAAAVRAAREAADALTDDLSRAQFELEQLSNKRNEWAGLCASSPLMQRPRMMLRQ